MPPTLYTVAETAAHYGVTANTIRRRIIERGIQPQRFGSAMVLTAAQVRALKPKPVGRPKSR